MGTEKKLVWVSVLVAVVALVLGSAVVVAFLLRGNASAPDPTGESWRLDYACPLAEEVEETKGSESAWEGSDLSDPDLDRVGVIGAALGGATGGSSVEDPDLADMGTTLFRGLSKLDPEMIEEGLERVRGRCADR